MIEAMRQSELFTKTRKEDPKDEVSKNAKLLTRAGFIYKEMAGVYDMLPLGLRTLRKIENIIREEMNAIGGQEVSLTTLQDSEIWKKTDRWDDEKIDVWFKTQLKNGTELGLGCTHEEPMTRMMKEFVQSYRDLPKYTYQFQTKFRNEVRAKSGIMRGREFLMKDMYSFNQTQEALDEFYEKSIQAYKNVYQRVGIADKTFLTFASGGMFSKFSHEFQTICDAGEDYIYIDKEKGIAVNEEVMQDDILQDLGLSRDKLKKEKSIEVGNIFKFGPKYSEPLGLLFKDENGQDKPVVMGAYGIGLGRLMGAVVELLADDKGIVWPKSIAPFGVHLVALGEQEAVKEEAQKLYDLMLKEGIEVLYDDRKVSAGEKLADADLIGLPLRIIVSEKTLKEGKVEVKSRTETEVKFIKIDEIIAYALEVTQKN